MASTGANAITQSLVSGAVAGINDFISQAKDDGIKKVNYMQVAVVTGAGLLAGAFGGDGIGHKNGRVAKAKKICDYAVDGIKNRKWTGSKGSKYLTLASKRLGKAWSTELITTTGKYTAGALGVAGAKRLYLAGCKL